MKISSSFHMKMSPNTNKFHIYSYTKTLCYIASILVLGFFGSVTSQIRPGSSLVAKENKAWISENGTFAFGFTPMYTNDQLQLGIWYNQVPGERILVWSANRDNLATKNAVLSFDNTGNLVLRDGRATLWSSNTSRAGVEAAVMSESGNFILYDKMQEPVFQTFSYPSDTLLPGQPLNVSMELTSSKKSPSHGGYYTLKMLQQPTSLSLALSYNLPDAPDDTLSNYSYWAGPDISNSTGDVVAMLNEKGSFGVVYGPGSSNGAVYVYKNDRDSDGLLYNKSLTPSTRATSLRRLVLEVNGSLRLYRWDDDVNGSRQWVSEWAAVTSSCDIAGICGNGVCLLDRTKTNSSCSCLPGTVRVGEDDDRCFENSTLTGKCNGRHENLTKEFKIIAVQQTNYHFLEESVIANYSDIPTVSKCGDACLDNCECVASVYGLNEEQPYCWVLRRLDYGGFQDPSSTLFVKVLGNESDWGESSRKEGDSGGDDRSAHEKALVIPIVLSMGVLIGLLCLLLYYNVHRKRLLKRAMESSLIFSGAPISFSYRDLQHCTSNFSQLLGRGGFGTVYKGSLGDGSYIAVKKLDKILPHGEREFITEVNTIGSMHHMNLVRLCGYCSEGSRRLLVYEFMKNGSLDKWIFAPNYNQDKVLDWPTRYNVALGTAQGIAYFHEQCRNRIIHCDIKPENILLDENFCPKVSDFGLAKLMGREHSHVVTMVRGTRGYLAPEWISNRPITVKADVYSYGMLLLEIVGGRRNLDMSYDAEDFFYPGWAFTEMVNEQAIKVVDKRLGVAVDEEEVTRALKIAFWCVQDEVSVRPSMGEVVKMFEGTMEVNMPPMPQNILELIEEGLDNVYKAMKRENDDHTSTFTINTNPSSRATCSYSTVSPR